ncbi:hypothetical protein BUALT_Bualt07G0054200 [Buddleja alternifolia]|uniref:Uncharacterized protein n=1 Tax=Buddleja alternifolia TaxID=168488 RepID=A0AAV6XGE9_9LAMI|nr:hypothetical protein BUALT_Bualt07G0054200 [Buddleja alternifolia]
MATDPSSMPITRGDDARRAVYQAHAINIHGYNAAGWIKEDEALIMALYLLEQEYYLTTDDNPGGLSEELISKYLKTRNCDKDKDDSEICDVCQNDLCQEDDQMIGVPDCSHEYFVSENGFKRRTFAHYVKPPHCPWMMSRNRETISESQSRGF